MVWVLIAISWAIRESEIGYYAGLIVANIYAGFAVLLNSLEK
jgi:hypothetical protein